MIAVVLDTRPVFEAIASVSSAIAVWASARARHYPESDSEPLDDITERLRHPVRWSVAHPLRAFGRIVRGR